MSHKHIPNKEYLEQIKEGCKKRNAYIVEKNTLYMILFTVLSIEDKSKLSKQIMRDNKRLHKKTRGYTEKGKGLKQKNWPS